MLTPEKSEQPDRDETLGPRSFADVANGAARSAATIAKPDTNPTRLTVFHDGACPLCQREIAVMRRLDRRGAIHFVDVADPATAGQCPIDPAALLARFHALENGRLLSGAAAFAAMWRVIPALRPLGQVARFPPLLWLLERSYRGFLRVRPRLQRWFAN